MALCGTAHSLGSIGIHLSCRLSVLNCKASAQLPIYPPSRSSHVLGNSCQRTFAQHFLPGLKNQRSTRVCFVPKEGNQELNEEQPSVIPDDISASKSGPSTVVEHVVFFKVKDDPTTEELFEELRALKSLDGISDLKACKVLQILGANFTHVLHSRHVNKASLDAYAVHPSHLAVVQKLAPYVEDRLAVDWEAVPAGLPIEGGHGAARIALIKLADDLTEEENLQVFGLFNGLRDKFPFIRQISAGNNFSPARAKGFNAGFVAMFDNLDELEELNGNAELHAVLRRSRVAPFMAGFVIADIDTKPN
ncbi:unnamed protein product [Calypogeia fissa]